MNIGLLNAQTIGLVAYIVILLTIIRPLWRSYLSRLNARKRQITVVRRERIDEMTEKHNRREAVRMGWEAPARSSANVTGGWR